MAGTGEDATLLGEALEALPDPVILVDRRAAVAFANAAARTAFPALAVGNPLVFALRMPEVVDAVERALRGEAAVEAEFTDRGPVERSFALRASPLPSGLSGSDRTRPAALLALRDLTGAKRLDSMRVDFVANASHEMRTPLASLLGFIETLQGPAKDDAAARARFLDIMRVQAKRMARLVDDLLSLSRVEMNEHRRPTAPADLGAVARQIADVLSRLAEERGVELECTLADGDRLVVAGDHDELLRVAENLVENAVKYGRSGGRVDIRVERVHTTSGDEIVLSVRDYGPGIPAEHLPRLTERFYRVDVAESRDKGGTGLGLAIVKHIVNRHRGRLAVESRPGDGATFRVALPALD